MTVSSQTSTATFVGNGVATAFPLPFRFFNNSDIFAYFIDASTGAATPMVIGVDYTLAGAGEPEVDGGALSVLTTTSPLASGRGMYVERIIPQTQQTDIVNQGEFFASTHEDVFDRLTMLIQQANANSAGAIRVAIGDPEPTRLVPAAQRQGKILSFDSQGQPVAIAPSSGDSSGLALILATPGEATGSAVIGFLQAGAGAVGRTAQSKIRERISVTDFMSDAMRADAASGAPVLDHSPAFAALFAYMPLGKGRAHAPGLSYRLDSNVVGTLNIMLEIDEGAIFVGAGSLSGIQSIDNRPADARRTRSGATDATTVVAVDEYVKLTNIGAAPGYGHRQDYIHTGTLASGFSLGKGNICLWKSIINGASGQASWVVATTPELASGGSWGVVVEEMNVMNRGPDTGYKKQRGVNTRWAGGIQVVAEANDLAGGTGNICRNSLFAFCTAQSSGLNDLGLTVKTYNGLLVEQDSIAANGRGALFSGDTSGVPASRPFAAIEVDQKWSTGIEMEGAVFSSGSAITLGSAHKITWGNLGTSINSQAGNIRLDSAPSTNIEMNPGGSAAARFSHVAGTVNFLNMYGNTAGASPSIGVGGTDTNIDIAIIPKGTGVINYIKSAVAATTPANFTATHMVDVKLNGVSYKIPARVAAW